MGTNVHHKFPKLKSISLNVLFWQPTVSLQWLYYGEKKQILKFKNLEPAICFIFSL